MESRLKEIVTITDVQSATENNDPNQDLNKQGSYTAAVYFADNEVTNPVAGADLVAKGTDAGGCVNEDMMVQGNRVLLESRYEYQFQKQVKS